MAGFVIDASATLPWCFDDESTPWTESLLDRLRNGEPAFAPAHWPVEVMNGLMMAQRRGRIDSARVARFIDDLAALPIRIESGYSPGDWQNVTDLAARYRLTAYDAAYLELSRRIGFPLATLDAELQAAAGAEQSAIL